MAMEGLFALVCAGAVLAGDPAPTKDERGTAIADALAVQTALQQARDYLLRNDYKNAVYVLENHLSRINGNRIYLGTLQEAYRGYVKDLRLGKQDAEAQKYLDRLRILDPGAVLDKSLTVGPAAPARAVPSAPTAPAAPAPKIRFKSEEESADPFVLDQRAVKGSSPARDLLVRADQEFTSKHYREARAIYEQLGQSDREILDASKERWAYCKLHYVVEQMSQAGSASPNWTALEQEARSAVDLAPRLDYGKYLLAEIQKRRAGGATNRDVSPDAPATVRHLGRSADGWSVVESASFRIYHNQSNDLAEQAAQAAEQTRSRMQQKWFGGSTEDWNPKCEVFLHPTGADYSRATGVPAASPGHSSIKMENGRVVGRRIDVRCDNASMLPAVLPHETTHVVIAGQYGDQPVPRWADEGIAVLAEPRDKVERHLQNLARCRQEGQTLGVQQLVQMNDYPDPRHISAFYAQSVSLVEFLSNDRGPQVFTQFLRDGLRNGYESALQKHYGIQGFTDLEHRWGRYAANGLPQAGGLAQRSR